MKQFAVYKSVLLTRSAKLLFSQTAHESTVTEKVASEECFLKQFTYLQNTFSSKFCTLDDIAQKISLWFFFPTFSSGKKALPKLLMKSVPKCPISLIMFWKRQLAPAVETF